MVAISPNRARSARVILNPLPLKDWRPVGQFKPLTAEKVIGINNLLSIAYLARGLELSKAVARIITPDGLGTGFLIGPDLLLSNNHVLPTSDLAAQSSAEFNYQRNWAGELEPSRRFALRTTTFLTSEALDYTLVQVEGAPGELYGYVDLSAGRDPEVNDYVVVIQHPNGGPKQIALTDNKVSAVFGHVMQYTTDTEPGSSGSAVFDQGWRIVGLHHAGGLLAGPDGRETFTNEAILISAVMQDMGSFNAAPDALYELAFGDLRSDIVNLLEKGVTEVQLRQRAENLTCRYPGFASGLSDQARMLSADGQAGSVSVVVAGIAIGAAFRHWARTEGHEAVSSVADPWFGPSEELSAVVAPFKGSGLLALQVYQGVLDDLQSHLAIAYRIIYVLGDDEEDQRPSVLATAFLIGVSAGGKAYEG